LLTDYLGGAAAVCGIAFGERFWNRSIRWHTRVQAATRLVMSLPPAWTTSSFASEFTWAN